MRSLLFIALMWSAQAYSSESGSVHAQNNYMLHCQGCHRADGSGLPGSVPSMKNFVSNFLFVPGGREFLIRVPGSANSSLSDKNLADLLNWMLSELSMQALPENFEPYTEDEVSRVRASILVDVSTYRAELVAQMNLP